MLLELFVDETDQIMMITDAGTLVRTRVSEVSVVGRNTQGVTLIRTAEDEKVGYNVLLKQMMMKIMMMRMRLKTPKKTVLMMQHDDQE